MLVEFSVENFRSFKDKVTLSLLASDDTRHESTNVITLSNGRRLLKSAVIYGANASGKSNLVLAMDIMSVIIATSHTMRPDDAIRVTPFKLCLDSINKPSKFDVMFYCNNVKYAYGFVASKKEVIEEYLYSFQPGSDEAEVLFSRENRSEYTFTDNEDKRVLEHISQVTNMDNKLFLSTAIVFSYKKFTDAYNWLCDMYSYSYRAAYDILRKGFFEENTNSEMFRNYVGQVMEWVKEIDVGISSIKIDTDTDLFKDRYSFDNDNTYERYTKILQNIHTVHKVKFPNGAIENTEFKFMDESIGTRTFFVTALAIAEKISKGGIFIVDELNHSLHTLLARHIVKLFHSPVDIGKYPQLLFTTHDTNLLDLGIFRRDQIWLMEKNPDTGATDMFSLCDFDDDDQDNERYIDIEKGYLSGVYGAIPYLGVLRNG